MFACLAFFLRSIYSDIKHNTKETNDIKSRLNVVDGTTAIQVGALTKNIDTLTNDIKQLTANVAHMNGNMKVQSEIISKVFEKIFEKNGK